MDTAPAPTISPTGNPTDERLETLLEERDRRLETGWNALSKDFLRETYEVEQVRRLRQRIEDLEHGTGYGIPSDPDEALKHLNEMRERLTQLLATQSDALGADNAKIEVVITKPNVTKKQRLDRIQQKIIAEQGRKALLEDAELVRESVRETVRTQVLWLGLISDPEEIREASMHTMADYLLRLEGKNEEQIKTMSALDPEVELTEEEREAFEPDESQSPAEMAERSLHLEERRNAALEAKRAKIIETRLLESQQRKEQLLAMPESDLLELIVQSELFQIAVGRAREELVDYWLLYCVQDAKKPVTGQARGDAFVKGYAPFFNTIQEVRDVKEGIEDFYLWLIAQRNRLDILTEEDLYALSAYAPFRDIILSMLGPRGGADPVAALFGSPPR